MNTPLEPPPSGAGPVRTCVGCRAKAPRSALVRVVLHSPGTHRAVVDSRASAPGRGAWLHADQQCLDLAARRRALPRALRTAGSLDLAAVHAWFAQDNDNESSKKKAGWKPMGTR